MLSELPQKGGEKAKIPVFGWGSIKSDENTMVLLPLFGAISHMHACNIISSYDRQRLKLYMTGIGGSLVE
jgi:hypothetical protein